MGGAGGGGGFSSGGFKSPEELIQGVRKADTERSVKEFDIAVSDEIAKLLASYNDRKVEIIQQHLDTIKEALSKEIAQSVDLRFAGSVAKHTYIDGVSDVDALVVLDNTDLGKLKPSEAKAYFEERLRERLPNTTVRSGSLAVTVAFTDIEVQLLAAFRRGRAVLIPSEREDRWVEIKPLAFSRALRDANERLGRRLIPTIKLAKAAMMGLPRERRLNGYHTEALAIKVFEDYRGLNTTKAMLQYFFSVAPSQVLSHRVRDRTGQSQFVDEYLGGAGSLQRRLAADALDRIGRKLRNADAIQSIDMWRTVLEVPFGEEK